MFNVEFILTSCQLVFSRLWDRISRQSLFQPSLSPLKPSRYLKKFTDSKEGDTKNRMSGSSVYLAICLVALFGIHKAQSTLPLKNHGEGPNIAKNTLVVADEAQTDTKMVNICIKNYKSRVKCWKSGNSLIKAKKYLFNGFAGKRKSSCHCFGRELGLSNETPDGREGSGERRN